MTWNLTETRDMIERLFGKEQLELARSPLKSVIDRQHFARYHYQEAIKLLNCFTEEHLTDKSLLVAVYGKDLEANAAFQIVMTNLGANAIACVQSMHAIPDILAHVFYYSLGINLKSPIHERSINATSISKLLVAKSQFAELGSALKSLTEDGQAEHLAALANHSKHRSIVQPQMNEDLTGERTERHELRFSSFEYNSKKYQSVSFREFLEPEYERSSKVTISAGQTLNNVLLKLLTKK